MLGNFRNLPARDKLFVLRCGLVVASVRLALLVLTYRQIARAMPPLAPRRRERRGLRQIRWAVANCARVVPGATCLTQALAAQYICARCGYAGVIRVGVRGAGTLNPHAWLIVGDEVVVGDRGHDLASYRPIVDLPLSTA